MTEAEESCPYCVVDGEFRPMTVSLKRIDLRELRPHRFPQPPGLQLSLPRMFEVKRWDHPRIRRPAQR
jgi:hypothetical protein